MSVAVVVFAFKNTPFSEILRPMNSLFHLNQYQLNGAVILNIVNTNIHGATTANPSVGYTLDIFYTSLYHGDMDDCDDVHHILSENFWDNVQR